MTWTSGQFGDEGFDLFGETQSAFPSIPQPSNLPQNKDSQTPDFIDKTPPIDNLTSPDDTFKIPVIGPMHSPVFDGSYVPPIFPVAHDMAYINPSPTTPTISNNSRQTSQFDFGTQSASWPAPDPSKAKHDIAPPVGSEGLAHRRRLRREMRDRYNSHILPDANQYFGHQIESFLTNNQVRLNQMLPLFDIFNIGTEDAACPFNIVNVSLRIRFDSLNFFNPFNGNRTVPIPELDIVTHNVATFGLSRRQFSTAISPLNMDVGYDEVKDSTKIPPIATVYAPSGRKLLSNNHTNWSTETLLSMDNLGNDNWTNALNQVPEDPIDKFGFKPWQAVRNDSEGAAFFETQIPPYRRFIPMGSLLKSAYNKEHVGMVPNVIRANSPLAYILPDGSNRLNVWRTDKHTYDKNFVRYSQSVIGVEATFIGFTLEDVPQALTYNAGELFPDSSRISTDYEKLSQNRARQIVSTMMANSMPDGEE